MIDAHLRRLRSRETVSHAEEDAIRRMVSEVKRFPFNAVIARAGEPLDHSVIVTEGWVARVKQPQAYERQITALCIAGDFADLHGLSLRELDHDLVALTECAVAIVPHERLEAVIESSGHLARLYRLMSNIDSAMQREWATSLGRRSRAAHLAHLFCELLSRLEIVGLAAGTTYEFPLTQNQLADCLGATPVHVNRVLQQLRATGMIRLQHRSLAITNLAALSALAKFDASYLFIDARHRPSIMVDGEIRHLAKHSRADRRSKSVRDIRAQP